MVIRAGNPNIKGEEKEEFTEKQNDLEHLCPDIIENILSMVPLKPRTRFKCASKRWRDIIDNLRKGGTRRPPSSAPGFLVYPLSQGGIWVDDTVVITSLQVAEDGGLCREVASTRVDDIPGRRRYYTTPGLVDCCNGVLLINDDGEKLFLLNPLVVDDRVRDDDGCRCPSQSQSQSRRILQLPTLSLPKSRTEWPHQYQYGMMYLKKAEEESECYAYGIICLELSNIIKYIKAGKIFYHLLSSDHPSEWRHRLAPLRKPAINVVEELIEYNIGTASFCGGNVRVSRHQGKLYWLFRKLAVVFDTEEKLFEIVKLPRQPSSCDVAYYLACNDGSRLLWGESDGNLYYCESFVGGLSVWKYHQQHHQEDYAAGCWVYKHRIPMAAGEPEKRYMMCQDVLCPLAFIEDFQTLYLIDQFSTIFSYSFETQSLSVASSQYSSPQCTTETYSSVAGYPFSIH